MGKSQSKGNYVICGKSTKKDKSKPVKISSDIEIIQKIPKNKNKENTKQVTTNRH